MLNVNLNGGMQDEYFAASQSILEDGTRFRTKPYFHGTKKEPLKLQVSFAFEYDWGVNDLRYVRSWLTEPTNYVPLIFSNEPEKIYYVLYVDEPELLHNSLSQGYLTLNFRCNDAYAFSPLMLSEIYEWEDNPFHLTQHAFVEGELNGLVLDKNNHLTLQPDSFTWNKLNDEATWNEIFK